MRRLSKTRLLSATVMAGLILVPALVYGQAAPAAPAAPAAAQTTDTTVDDVVVTGQGRAKTAQTASSDRTLRLDPSSASNCNFVAGSDTYIEDFIASMGVTRTKGKSLVDGQQVKVTSGTLDGLIGAPVTEGDTEAANAAANGVYFSESSPFGDASGGSGVDITANLIGEGNGNACGAGDRLAVAGRASIARRDRTMPEGYRLYDAGKRVEAIESFKKGYAKLPDGDGGLEAAYMIGKATLELPAAQRDGAEAITWLKKAAGGKFNLQRDVPAFDPDNPYVNDTVLGQSAALLGQVYLTGVVVPRDVAEAAKWYERAEEVGYVPAGKLVGDLYYYGNGVPKDPAKAVKYYKKAATLGFAPAQYALANILYLGDAGQREDLQTALAWYEQAAKRNHPGAQFALAEAFDLGEGVATDRKRALAYYTSAALGGNADAQAALGTFFYQGEQVAKDLPTARKWFEAAAQRQQPEAMFNLAAMQTKGEGGDKDLVKAWVWFSLAKARGHENAAAAIASVERQMSGEQRQAAAQILAPKAAG